MFKSLYIVLSVFLFGTASFFAQNKPVQVTDMLVAKDSIKTTTINPLAPSKAAFYSAILPGLGQAYNKKYWKIPLVYGAIGTSLYSYIWNNKKYHQYRDAYKSRLAGKTNDDFQYLDTSRLISAQKFHQKNRDLSKLVTAGLYILNIVDANIDAHLMQFNVNENLSVRPEIQQSEFDNKQNLAVTLSFHF